MNSLSPINHWSFVDLSCAPWRNQHDQTLWTTLHEEVEVSYPSFFLTGSWIFIPVHFGRGVFSDRQVWQFATAQDQLLEGEC